MVQEQNCRNGKLADSEIKVEIPPTDFFPDISDVNERKMRFFNQCKEELKLSRKYLTWVDKEFKLFSSHKTASQTKGLKEGTLKLTRERYSGRNNFDTSKKQFSNDLTRPLFSIISKF